MPSKSRATCPRAERSSSCVMWSVEHVERENKLWDIIDQIPHVCFNLWYIDLPADRSWCM